MIRVALFALLALAAATAHAQSKKYPPVPVDKDAEAEQRSELWESALNPNLGPYTELVRAAEHALSRRGGSDTKLALEKLDEAIAKMPKQPTAYLARGRLYLKLGEWAKCAGDLGVAEDLEHDEIDPVARTALRIDLGVCQARAGRYADAERTLVRAAASAPSQRGELGLRLGEVRIALGKLDEAIDALTAALDASDIRHELTRWLLVAAFDRARRPTQAQEAAELARRHDPARTHIESPALPLLDTGDQEYLLGVAYRYATRKPEYALVYFRRFVALAPDSPWRRRAEEHVRELSGMKLPAAETITSTGSAAFAVEEMRDALARPMRTLRQCVAALPTSAFQVTVTKVGPRTPERRDRPLYHLPSPGVRVAPVLTVGESPPPSDTLAAAKCLEREVTKVRLPPPKEKDTWYMMSFIVVAP